MKIPLSIQMRHYDEIKQKRNPLFNPGLFSKNLINKQSIEKVVGKLDLLDNIHLSLDVATLHLEHSIHRLQLGTDLMLAHHGKDVLQKHAEVARLTEAAVLNYALFCSVARASRAVCLKLPYVEHERLIVTCLAHECSEKVKYMMIDIENGSIYSYDTHFEKLAEQLFLSKGYFFEHPLTRNF